MGTQLVLSFAKRYFFNLSNALNSKHNSQTIRILSPYRNISLFSFVFILVYLSQGQDVRIQMSKLRSLGKAYWFNPRNGARTLIGPVENKGIRTFNAPGEAGERGNDWILILEADDR